MNRHITSAISQNFKKFASKEFPPTIQNFINASYVKLMGLNMNEFDSSKSYKSLTALFTRKLLKDRDYSKEENDFISPCDSLVTECGQLEKNFSLQIKGMYYKCDELLGENFTEEEKQSIYNGEFINFYLSPKDYHRYHIPTDLQILRAVHIPGKLYPVNIPSLNKRANLFVENERVVLMCETPQKKKIFIVLVGALNVGVMRVSFEPKIKTNANAYESSVYNYENLHVKKGLDFGCFEMGSTIVVLSQKDTLKLKVKSGENVKYSQTVANLL
jgi:phosphatidylserine decarboxylase